MDVRLAADLARVATESRAVARESTQAPAQQVEASRPGPQASAAQSDASAAENVQTTASGQFYVSPYLTFDSRSLTVIFQVRDTESGDVTRQFPAESVVERYRRDPTARPFVLPEPSSQAEEPAGPPPPTIGGPVAEAASEAEQRGDAPPSTSNSGSNTPTGGEPGTDGGGEPATPPRVSVDLVA